MCFSATASFVVAGGLSVIGVLSVSSVKKKEQYPLAIIPFLFAIQQAAEGVVWITLNNVAYQLIHKIFALIYLSFAMAFWPTWIPFTLLILEKEVIRKKVLMVFYVLGSIVAAYSFYRIFLFPVNVKIFEGNLCYYVSYKRLFMPNFYLFCYSIPTILSFFVSSIQFMWFFRFIVTGALLLSYIAWYTTMISVWCFFAALLSVTIFLHLRLQPK